MCVFRLTRFGDRGHGVCDWFEVCVWGECVGGVGCVLWNKRHGPRFKKAGHQDDAHGASIPIRLL